MQCETASLRGPPVAGAGDRGCERNGAVSASDAAPSVFAVQSWDFSVRATAREGKKSSPLPTPVKVDRRMACVFSLDQPLVPIGPPAWHRRERQVLARHHPFLLRQWQTPPIAVVGGDGGAPSLIQLDLISSFVLSIFWTRDPVSSVPV